MGDLIAYLNRDDVPVMVQAAIGHAQFESIHAFTDGNGRIGRALVSAVLRRRGVTRNTVIPLASGLLARREDYFAALGEYRRGRPDAVIELFARSARAAALCSRATIARITSMPAEWTAELRPRAGSAVAALIPAFYDHPVMAASEIEQRSGSSEQTDLQGRQPAHRSRIHSGDHRTQTRPRVGGFRTAGRARRPRSSHPVIYGRLTQSRTYRLPAICRPTISRMISFVPP